MPPPEKSAYTRLSLEKILNAQQAFAVSLVDYQPLPEFVLDSSFAVETSLYFVVLRRALPFSEAVGDQKVGGDAGYYTLGFALRTRR